MGEHYINIGSEKCCCFVRMSMLLITQLDKNPFLYYAVEEALECAKNGYYSTGILTFSQLLNLLHKKTPAERHLVAHDILQFRPTKESYEKIEEAFKNTATHQSITEQSRRSSQQEYNGQLTQKWNELIAKLHQGVDIGVSPTP